MTQVREVASALARVAKERNLTTILVGHVTKDGSLAGPRALEHLVDVVLHAEGERHSTLRLVRTVKNRYGAADEVGCFEQDDSGLREVPDPSGLFLSQRGQSSAGTCVTITIEGRRCLPAEVQTLIGQNENESGTPSRRAVSGLESPRVQMLMAVVDRYGDTKLARRDVYASTVGGIKVTEPAADLAVAIAITGAFRQKPPRAGLIAIGEVGLSGEIRRVPGVGRRLTEAARLGFTSALIPPDSGPLPKLPGFTVRTVATLGDALKICYAPRQA